MNASNPTRDAVIDRSRLASLAEAALPAHCTECGNGIAGDEDGFCADCTDHEYTVTVYLTMKGKQDLYAMEKSLMRAIDRMPNMAGVDCEAVEGVVDMIPYVPIHRCPGCGQATDLSMCSRCTAAGVGK